MRRKRRDHTVMGSHPCKGTQIQDGAIRVKERGNLSGLWLWQTIHKKHGRTDCSQIRVDAKQKNLYSILGIPHLGDSRVVQWIECQAWSQEDLNSNLTSDTY